MGPMMRRLLYVMPGWIAALGALVLGVHVAYVAIALVLYSVATPLTPTPRTVLLLAAPLVVTAGLTVESLLAVSALVTLALALLACAPLYLFLGGRVPLVAPLVWIVLTTVLLAPIVFLRFAPSFFTSDIATRSQILFLGAACLILSGIMPLVRQPQRQAEATEKTYVPLLDRETRTQTHAQEQR